jgi:hypothetical protein
MKRELDVQVRKWYRRAFYFKVICVVVFALLTEFYFKGGDTSLYYQAAKDIKSAVSNEPELFWTMLKTSKINVESPLFIYFYNDGYELDLTYEYMQTTSNFTVPKLAFFPLYIFGGSYISICMLFGFFSFCGSIYLFRFFRSYFPSNADIMAFASLFLPSVAFWGSGLLKDSITYGCVGFLLFGLHSLIRRRSIFRYLFLMALCIYLLFMLKIYILLVLTLAVIIWYFTELARTIKRTNIRVAFTIIAFSVAVIVGISVLRNLTSLESAKEFRLETLTYNIANQQQQYANINRQLGGRDSYFKIANSNPVLLVLSGIAATFYRPFVWEITSPIVVLSAIESGMFLLLTLHFVLKRGLLRLFIMPFSDSVLLMAFTFAITFAISVGISTANFGALSRYKIPCMPFYLIYITSLYRMTNLALPQWFVNFMHFFISRPRRQAIIAR